MVYSPYTWTVSTRISAEALNHLETQYDEVMAMSTTWNDHTSLYYTKEQVRSTFFNPLFMGPGSGANADLLDGHHASEIMGKGLPIGAIVWWASESLPTGWYQCDGSTQEGVLLPDYRDRFVVGASLTHTTGNVYGQNAVTPTTSTYTIGATSLSESQIPSHRHVWSETHAVQTLSYYEPGFGYSGPYRYYQAGDATTAITSNTTGSGTAHTHPGSTIAFSSESNIPPYYVLYLIKRVS